MYRCKPSRVPGERQGSRSLVLKVRWMRFLANDCDILNKLNCALAGRKASLPVFPRAVPWAGILHAFGVLPERSKARDAWCQRWEPAGPKGWDAGGQGAMDAGGEGAGLRRNAARRRRGAYQPRATPWETQFGHSIRPARAERKAHVQRYS